MRGDIQRGDAGDKKPGFDPAAAPLETDAEAGGATLGPDQIRQERNIQHNPDPSDWQGTRATAMRAFDGEAGAGRDNRWRYAAAVSVAIVILLAVILIAIAW